MKENVWSVKYRPKKFEDFYCPSDIKEEIDGIVKSRNMTHLIFHGESGVGKTTLSYILARLFLGKNFSSDFLELNASDDRGIGTIQDIVKPFVETMPSSGSPFKICFLDESEGLTNDAKSCLRSIIEKYSKNVRFIFACNDLSKLESGTNGKAIISRCRVLPFYTMGLKNVKEKVGKICESEKFKIDDDAVECLYDVCGADMRKIENYLQNLSNTHRHIKINNIQKEIINEDFLKDIVKDMLNGHAISSLNKIYPYIKDNKMLPADFFHKVCNLVFYNQDIDSKRKYNIIKDMIYAEEKLKQGANYLDVMLFVVLSMSYGV